MQYPVLQKPNNSYISMYISMLTKINCVLLYMYVYMCSLSIYPYVYILNMF